MAAIPKIWIDVTMLPAATEVCVGTLCVPVDNGLATLDESIIAATLHELDLIVHNADGKTIAKADDVELPRAYPNGPKCGGDAPRGTVTFDGDGKTSVSDETHGFTPPTQVP